MPRINIAGVGTAEFPDSMSMEEIDKELRKKFPSAASNAPPGVDPDLPALHAVNEAAATASVAQHGAVAEVAGKTGLPPDVARAALPELQASLKREKFDAGKLKEQSPGLAAAILENPTSGPALMADKKPLSFFEWILSHNPARGISSVVEETKKGWARGSLDTEMQPLIDKQRQQKGHLAPDDQRKLEELEAAQAAAREGDIGIIPYVPAGVAENLPRYIRGLPNIASRGLAAATAFGLAGSAVGGVGALPAAGVGAATGAAFGVFEESFRSEGNLFYRELLRDGVDPETAEVGALIVGVANGTLEAAPIDKVLRIVPGVEAVLHGPTKEIVKRAFKDPSVKAALKRATKRLGEGMLWEGVTEALQTVTSQVVGAGAKGQPMLEAVVEGLPETLESGLKGAAVGGGMHVVSPGTIIETGSELTEARKARALQEYFQAAGSAAAQSEAFKALPKESKRFVKDLRTKYGGVDTVSIPAEKLAKVTEGVDLEEVAPDVAAQLAAATGPEDEVTVRTDDMFVHLAALPGFEELTHDIRAGDHMTAREAASGVLEERIKETQEQGAQGQRSEPPVPEGHVRLYHGGVEGGEGPRWLSPDRKYAEGYAAKSMGGKVRYVDLPAGSPLLEKTFDDSGTSAKAPYKAFEAPPEVASKLREVAVPDGFQQQAEESAGLKPLDPERLFTDEEYKAYEETFTKAQEEARAFADRASTREWRRQVSDDYDAFHKAASEEVAADPAMNMRQVLLHGEDLNGNKAAPTMWWANRRFSLEWADQNLDPAMKRAAVELFGADGIDPDLVAPFYPEFDDARDMIAAVVEKGTPQGWARRTAKARLAGKYPAFQATSKEGARRWARENVTRALHVDAVGNAIWAGAVALGKQVGGAGGTKARVVIKEAARRAVGDTKVWALNLRLAERNEGQAAFRAAEAWRAKDAAKAYEETRKQLYWHYMWRETLSKLEAVDKFKDQVKRLKSNDAREKIAEGGIHWTAGIDTVLYRLGLSRFPGSMPYEEVVAKCKEQGTDAPLSAEELAALPEYDDLTSAELEEVAGKLQAFATLGRNFGRSFIAEQKQAFKERVAELADHVRSNTRVPPDSSKGLAMVDATKKFLSEQGWKLRKVEFLCRILDGGDTAGLAHRAIFQPFVDAEVQEHLMQKDLIKDLRAEFQEFSLQERFHLDRKVSFLGVSMPRRDLLGVALNMRNEGNEQRLMATYRNKGWTREQVLAALDRELSDKDITMVNRLGALAGRYWEDVKKTHLLHKGYEPAEVTGKGVTLPSGRLIEGGYYPVVKDFNKVSYHSEEVWDPSFEPAAVGRSFTMERADRDFDPITVSIDALPRHLFNVIHYVTHFIPVTEVNRLTQAGPVRSTIEERVSVDAYNQIFPWLRSIARGSSSDFPATSFGDSVMRHLRFGATINLLFGKLSTGSKQILGLTTTLKEIGAKHTIYGTGKFLADVAAWGARGFQGPGPFEAISAVDPAFELFHINYDREIRDLYTRAFSATGALSSARQGAVALGMVWFNLVQGTVNAITWEGAYKQALDQGRTEQEAKEYAGAKVRMSQSSGGVKDLAAVQRGSETHKMFTIMYSWFSVLYNQIAEPVYVKGEGGVAKAQRVAAKAAHLFWLVALPVILEQALKGEVEEEGEDPDDRTMRRAVGMSLFAAKSVPYVNLGVEALIDQRDARPAPWISAYTNGLEAMGDLASEGPEELSEGKVRALVNFAGTVLHLPAQGAYNGLQWWELNKEGLLEEKWRDLFFRSPREFK